MEKRLIFTGRKIRLYTADVTLPSGRTVAREIVEHPGAVVVLPMSDNGNVFLESHYRFAIGQNLLEAPAGTLDPGEDADTAARRELLEETGFTAREWVRLGEFYSSPGVMTELMRAYLARGLTPGQAALEEDEELEIVEMPLQQALGHAADGTIKDAKTIATLFLAQSFLQRERGWRT